MSRPSSKTNSESLASVIFALTRRHAEIKAQRTPLALKPSHRLPFVSPMYFAASQISSGSRASNFFLPCGVEPVTILLWKLSSTFLSMRWITRGEVPRMLNLIVRMSGAVTWTSCRLVVAMGVPAEPFPRALLGVMVFILFLELHFQSVDRLAKPCINWSRFTTPRLPCLAVPRRASPCRAEPCRAAPSRAEPRQACHARRAAPCF